MESTSAEEKTENIFFVQQNREEENKYFSSSAFLGTFLLLLKKNEKMRLQNQSIPFQHFPDDILHQTTTMGSLSDTSTTSSLTDSQERVLNTLGIASASLSICGSVLIITRIIRCQYYKGSPYNRIMIGLCFSDIISSIASGFSFLFLPRETSPRVWAFGNETTCNMLGFLTQVGYAAFW